MNALNVAASTWRPRLPWRLLLVATAMVVGGCDGPANSGAETPVATTDKGVVGELDHTEVSLPPESAQTKRLSVDMLSDSLGIVAGADASGQTMTWRINYLGDEYVAFQVLSKTLGKPDYVQITHENLEPTSLYLKFMHDMSSNVCEQIVAADETKGPSASDRVLTRFASLDKASTSAEINDNLRYLSLRFHSVRVADDDDAGVADLRDVFDRAKAEASQAGDGAGWHAVCIALLLSPSFHLY